MSKNKIIQISGKMGSGKDTIQDLIEGYIYENYNNGQKNHRIEFTNFSFASKLKEVAAIMLGVNKAKLSNREFKNSYLNDWGMTVRSFLQKLGTEAIRRGLHPNAWVICYKNDVVDFFNKRNYMDINIIFTTDLRMKNEADLSQEWFKGDEYELYQIRVKRKLKIRNWLLLDGIHSLIDNQKDEFSEVWDEYITSTDYINLVDLYNFKTPEDRERFEQVKEARAHFSETDLDDYKPMDFNIENGDDLIELENKVYTICDSIFPEWSDLDN